MRQRLLPAMLGVAACLASVSCGGGGNAPQNSKSSDLALNKSTLDFGNVAVGDSRTTSLTLSNSSASGSPNISISDIVTSGSAFSVNVPSLPLVLTPGQSAVVAATFEPKSAGKASGTLSITVDGAGVVTVPLSGAGVAQGQLSVSPPSLNFGSVAVGSSKNLGGTLTAGSSSITVTSADWNGQGYSVGGITFPLTIPAGQSASFTVTFAPEGSGTFSGRVSFASDASNSPAVQTFTGTGTQAAQHLVELTWDPSTDVVVGYYVYRGTRSGGPYARLNSSPQPNTNYSDSQVQGGVTYYYVTTAVDENSNESVFSNQATVQIPSP